MFLKRKGFDSLWLSAEAGPGRNPPFAHISPQPINCSNSLSKKCYKLFDIPCVPY